MSHHGKSTIQNNEDGVWDKRGWCGGDNNQSVGNCFSRPLAELVFAQRQI